MNELLSDNSISTIASTIEMNYQIIRNQSCLNRYSKSMEIEKKTKYLNTRSGFLLHGVDENRYSSWLCKEAILVQQHTESPALIRTIMNETKLIYLLPVHMAKNDVELKEKKA